MNNSLWDLYYLLRFFLRQDSALAGRGIVNIRDRFKAATKQDPSNLSPDFLYPIIDAITVKRIRGFVRKFYADATLRGPDGVLRPIVFPKAVAITVRYDLESMAPGLFDAVADALDPAHGTDVISFARYAPRGAVPSSVIGGATGDHPGHGRRPGGERKLGVIVPIASQIDSERDKWGPLARPPLFAAVSPYSDGPEAVLATGERLQAEGAEAVLLDCIGFTERHRDTL